MRRVLSVLGTPVERRPLGQLIRAAKKTLEQKSGSWRPEDQERFRFLPVALHELERLDLVNKKGVKHADGLELTWSHVVQIHTRKPLIFRGSPKNRESKNPRIVGRF